jgi:DNA polymerase elongation subunit (family B)
MDQSEDKFLKNIYDGLQLAYKVTANGLYGLLGASTSPIYMKELAASTTATGRQMLEFSRDFIEGPFGELINLALENEEKFRIEAKKLFTYENEKLKTTYPSVYTFTPEKKFIEPRANRNNMNDFIEYFYKKSITVLNNRQRVKPKIIYGDTDSVFFTMKIHDIETKDIKVDKEALQMCIEFGQLAGATICKILPEPEEQVYEKTLWPLVLISKKRYVGNLYETDVNKYYQKSMGIVLKRRDNAKIVKIVVGGIVNYILNERSNQGAIDYTRSLIKKILRGHFGIDKFIITKTLKGVYKGTKQTTSFEYDKITNKKTTIEAGTKGSWAWDDINSSLAHVSLCQRIKKRDPGNSPEMNDRIPYVYIIPKGKVLLQGDRIEDPKYVIQNNLELDYLFYITNQIMKPSIQFLELIAHSPEKLFQNYINKEINRRKNISSIFNYVIDDDNNDNNNNQEEEQEIKQTKNKKTAQELDKELEDKYTFNPIVNTKKTKKSSKINNKNFNIKKENSKPSLTIEL